MASLLQQLLAPLDPFGPPAREQRPPAGDEDVPLGCESANPALQFECWEPLPTSPAAPSF
ncbi:MAG TPA: hypothetical protein VEA40_23775 [Ramlibacter sp.]|nr:hypothetical protein [Ramlibacter sp.]